MKHPTTAWWCGYWKEAYPEQTDVVDRGVDCPTHERNDGGPAEDRGCRPVAVVPLPPEGERQIILTTNNGEWPVAAIKIVGDALTDAFMDGQEVVLTALTAPEVLDALALGEEGSSQSGTALPMSDAASDMDSP